MQSNPQNNEKSKPISNSILKNGNSDFLNHLGTPDNIMGEATAVNSNNGSETNLSSNQLWMRGRSDSADERTLKSLRGIDPS